MWQGTRAVIMLAGIRPPTQDALRDTLRELASIDPHHRMFLTAPPRRSTWVRVDAAGLAAHCARMVAWRPGRASDEPDALLRRLYLEADPTLPLAFAVGDDFVAISADHRLADGRTMLVWLAELWRCALSGGSPMMLVHRNVSFPVARGLSRLCRQDPRRPLTLARDLLGRDGAGATAAGPEPAATSRPWSPDVTAVGSASDPDALQRLRDWRKRHAPDVSLAAVTFAATLAAAEAEGLHPPAPGFGVVVDNRRYLGPDTRYDGNLSSGLFLRPRDPSSPADLGATMNRALSSGRALAALAAGTALATRRAPAPEPPERIDAAGPPRVNLNYMGRLAPFEQLPGGTGPDARFHIVVTPWSPDAVTFFMAEVAGRLNVTAAFHASTFDPRSIEPTVARLCADPVGLLERRKPVRV